MKKQCFENLFEWKFSFLKMAIATRYYQNIACTIGLRMVVYGMKKYNSLEEEGNLCQNSRVHFIYVIIINFYKHMSLSIV